MPDVYFHPHPVEPAEIDDLGHANNIAYVAWLQAAAVAHSAAQGWPPERYCALGQGWVVRSHWIEYLQPAFAGDRAVVETWVATMKKVTSLRRYRIVRAGDGQLLATAETNWAFVDLASGKPARIPPELAAAFAVVQRRDDGTTCTPTAVLCCACRENLRGVGPHSFRTYPRKKRPVFIGLWGARKTGSSQNQDRIKSGTSQERVRKRRFWCVVLAHRHRLAAFRRGGASCMC